MAALGAQLLLGSACEILLLSDLFKRVLYALQFGLEGGLAASFAYFRLQNVVPDGGDPAADFLFVGQPIDVSEVFLELSSRVDVRSTAS